MEEREKGERERERENSKILIKSEHFEKDKGDIITHSSPSSSLSVAKSNKMSVVSANTLSITRDDLSINIEKSSEMRMSCFSSSDKFLATRGSVSPLSPTISSLSLSLGSGYSIINI